MNDQQKAFLEHGKIVLPERIDHDCYLYVVEALLEKQGNPVELLCNGNGGATDDAMAICDLIREHGNVVGVLAGDARSANTCIFCSCAARYIYPNGLVSVHRPVMQFDAWMDERGFSNLMNELAITEKQMIDIYVQASNQDEAFWRKLLHDAGDHGFIHLDAERCIELGLARPIAELRAEQRAAVKYFTIPEAENNGKVRISE